MTRLGFRVRAGAFSDLDGEKSCEEEEEGVRRWRGEWGLGEGEEEEAESGEPGEEEGGEAGEVDGGEAEGEEEEEDDDRRNGQESEEASGDFGSNEVAVKQSSKG